MSDKSAIEWTDATWQVASGCSPVSAACRGCYSARLAGTRLKHHPRCEGLTRQAEDGRHVWTGEVRLHPDQLDQPLRWRKGRRIFVGDRTDLFHPAIPDDYIDRVWAVMALTPQHTYQVLTKRPERMREYLSAASERIRNLLRDTAQFMTSDELVQAWGETPRAVQREAYRTYARFDVTGAWVWPLLNVWLGTSIEDQATAAERVINLRCTPATVRFVSAEPLLGPIDLRRLNVSDYVGSTSRLNALTGEIYIEGNCGESSQTLRGRGLDWVIVGGESGPHARPMHPDWARSLRDQCAAAGVAYHFKQWGEWGDYTTAPHPHGITGNPEVRIIDAVGNIRGGGSLHDGYDWDGPDHAEMIRVGKSAAGRLLDGVEHNEMPT